MKKKWISILLAVIMTVTFTCSVLAADVPQNNNGLYIQTEPCPEEAITYAKEHLGDFLTSIRDEFGTDISGYELGRPFVLKSDTVATKVAYFPVILNGEITHTLRVFKAPDDQYYGVLSTFLANELGVLSRHTMPEQPAMITLNNDNLISVMGDAVSVIEADKEAKPVTYNSQIVTYSNTQTVTVNCMETITYEKNLVQPRAVVSSYLATSIMETQQTTSWCGAYSEAMIIRYKKNNYCVASEIAGYFGKTQSQGFMLHEIIQYANTQGLYPQMRMNVLTSTEFKSQINNYKPVFMGFYLSNGDGHFMVGRGYNSSTYSIWNPWYWEYETMYVNSEYYVDRNNTSWHWMNTIYNW